MTKTTEKTRYKSLFQGVSLRTKTAKILTDLAEEDPARCVITDAIVMYPYVKWTLIGEPLTWWWSGEDSEGVFALKRMLSDSFEIETALHLRHREKYYALASPFVTQMMDLLSWIESYPRNGPAMNQCLMTVMGEADEPCSLHILDKYLPEVVQILTDYKTAETEEVLIPLIQFIEEEHPEEQTNLYHNVAELLKKYEELKYVQMDQNSILSKVLDCKTPADVVRVTTNLDEVIGATHITEFLLTISGAIAMLQSYPVKGSTYYRIIWNLTCNRARIDSDGFLRRASEEEVGMGLDLKKANFSIYKREAFEALGLLLWGADRTVLTKLGVLP